MNGSFVKTPTHTCIRQPQSSKSLFAGEARTSKEGGGEEAEEEEGEGESDENQMIRIAKLPYLGLAIKDIIVCRKCPNCAYKSPFSALSAFSALSVLSELKKM